MRIIKILPLTKVFLGKQFSYEYILFSTDLTNNAHVGATKLVHLPNNKIRFSTKIANTEHKTPEKKN